MTRVDYPKKKKRCKQETPDEKIERKIKEYHMQKERTAYARRNFSLAMFAVLLGSTSLLFTALTTLKIFGLI